MYLDLAYYRKLLGITDANQLLLKDSRAAQNEGAIRESHLLREETPEQVLVAHYRIWFKQSLRPPYRTQQGWEKFDAAGNFLDREIRFSRKHKAPNLQ